MSLESSGLNDPFHIKMSSSLNNSPLDNKGRLKVTYYHTNSNRVLEERTVDVQGYKGFRGKLMKLVRTAEYLGTVTITKKGKPHEEKIYVNKRSLGKQILIKERMDPKRADDKEVKDKAIEILFPDSASESSKKEFEPRRNKGKIADFVQKNLYVSSELATDVRQELSLEKVYHSKPKNSKAAKIVKQHINLARATNSLRSCNERLAVIQAKVRELASEMSEWHLEIDPDHDCFKPFTSMDVEQMKWLEGSEKQLKDVERSFQLINTHHHQQQEAAKELDNSLDALIILFDERSRKQGESMPPSVQATKKEHISFSNIDELP